MNQQLSKDFFPDSQHQEYESSLVQLTNIISLVAIQENFINKYGFSLKGYLEQRDKCSALMRGISDYLDKLAIQCGIIKAAGGSASIVGAVMSGFGLCLAPVSGGISLFLTLGGTFVTIGGASANFISTIKKDSQLRSKIIYAGQLVNSLKPKNAIVQKLLGIANAQTQKIMQYSKYTSYSKWLSNVKSGYSILNNGIQWLKTTKEVTTITRSLANAIQLNCQIMKDIAVQLSAPRLNFLNFTAKTGRNLAVGLAALGILIGVISGVNDIKQGVSQMGSGLQQAESLRESSFQFDGITRQLDNFINFSKKSLNQPLFDRHQNCVLVSKASNKVLYFKDKDMPAHLWQCIKTQNQIINISSGLNVTLQNNFTHLYATVNQIFNGANIEQHLRDQNKRQVFSLVPVKNGKNYEYTIEVGQKRVFSVKGSIKDNGTPIHVWDKTGGANQSWFICNLSKQKVTQTDCDGFGSYYSNYCEQICQKCKKHLDSKKYYLLNQDYSQCNSCGIQIQIGKSYYFCKFQCSKWGFCQSCAQKSIIPYGCDTKKCGKCKKTSLKSFKYYGGNWNYKTCNGCKESIPLNTFYWYCESCKSWGYCYKCTMKGNCGSNG